MRLYLAVAVVVAVAALTNVLPARAKPSDEYNAAVRAATLLYDQQKYEEAIAAAKQVLLLAERDFGQDDMTVRAWLNNIDDAHRLNANKIRDDEARQQYLKRTFDEREAALKQGLAIADKRMGAEHSTVAISLSKLGDLYTRLGRTEDADRSDRRANAVRKKLCGGDNECLATLANPMVQLSDAPVAVNATITQQHPASGALLLGSNARTAALQCSGTLVGCNKFLTAAHCVDENKDPKAYSVFFQNAGFFLVKKIDSRPEKDADVAVLTLDRSVDGIEPIAINRTASPVNGSLGDIVGFGRTGGQNQDYGIKRVGVVTTAPCGPKSKKLLCWDFDGWQSNTCNADSGGGLFMSPPAFKKNGSPADDVQMKVVGITRAGARNDCLAGDHSIDTDVFSHRVWIAKQIKGTVATEACGNVYLNARRAPNPVFLSDTHPEDVYTFEIDDLNITKPLTLRVTMNGEDDTTGSNDFDLYVIPGKAPTVEKAVCSEKASGQFAVCQISQFLIGDWTVVVRRKKGAGLLQRSIVVTYPRDR